MHIAIGLVDNIQTVFDKNNIDYNLAESVKIGFLCDERYIIPVKSNIARKIFQGLKIVTKTVVLLDTDEYKTTTKLD